MQALMEINLDEVPVWGFLVGHTVAKYPCPLPIGGIYLSSAKIGAD